jgi:hypothetical protein
VRTILEAEASQIAGGEFRILNEILEDAPLKSDERLSFVAASGPQILDQVVSLIGR